MSAAVGISTLKQLSSWKVFGGIVRKYQHHSAATRTDMKFSVFTPQQVVSTTTSSSIPAIYYLAGLTCTDDTFMHKAGAFRAATSSNVALICPDTSPRGLNLPEEKSDAISGKTWDFGEGAGFYLTATNEKLQQYNMAKYVTEELPALIAEANIGVNEKRSIMGHSMGGHGALVSFLRNPGMYASASAFAPICNPSKCDWGKKAFTGYLKSEEEWKQWDATHLASNYSGPAATLLVDQGTVDEFLVSGQLLPQNLETVVKSSNKLKLNLRMREGYDHSYYFIQTFVDEHIEFHAKHLHGSK